MQLMLRGGLIRQSCSGIYHFLPMGQRALDKLSQLVHSAMGHIGAQKMAMPFLTPAALWKKTGGKSNNMFALCKHDCCIVDFV